MRAVVAILGGALAAAACGGEATRDGGAAGPPPAAPVTVPVTTTSWTCDGGLAFEASFQDPETADLFLPDGAITLPRVPSASGARYARRATTFWTKGDSAFLERPGEPRRACVNDPRKAVWDDALLRGVEFRAVGQEPGWTLEQARDLSIVVVTDYGAERLEFPPVEPEHDAATGTTTFRARADGRSLVVTVEERPCRDTMSGEAFPTTVIVRIDGETLRGCGRWL